MGQLERPFSTAVSQRFRCPRPFSPEVWNLLPGWEAQVDGKAASLRRSHGTFMSLELPAGRHAVELRYRPASVYAGALVSLGTLVLLLAVVLVSRLRRRRSDAADGTH